MFNLEQAIAEWRRQMLAAGIKHPAPLDELESHLRQDIRALVSAGKPGTQAFQLAVARLGSPSSVRTEFNKIKGAQIRPVKIGSALWIGATILLAALLSRGLFAGELNLLVYAHVLSITLGYGTAFLIGGFGICYICYRSFHALSPVRQQSLSQAVYLFSHLAVGLLIVGLMLGMPVSKQYFGRYWRGDPKEIGGLCVSVWLIALAVMQRFGKISDRAMMLMCIGGNVIVSLAWFGAGIIDSSPRMQGYGIGSPFAVFLVVFLGIHLCFLMMGLAPAAEAAES